MERWKKSIGYRFTPECNHAQERPSFLCHICRGAGEVRQTEGERAESGISRMAGSGREIQKGKLSLFVIAYIQSKKRTQQRFLTSI